METKLCTKCDKEKPVDEFNKNKARKDGLATMCRQCWKAYYKTYYESGKEKKRLATQRKTNRESVKAYIQAAKNVPCADCGNSYPSYVMDFDHLGDKSFTISQKIGYSLKKIKEEIAKCDVVCSNCHRIRTHNRRSPVAL
jgi:hypothetical protein